MDTPQHLDALRHDGKLLADAATRAELDAPVPSCPGWAVRDLVHHIGDVHRWAASHVAERRTERIRDVSEVAGPLPSDERLLDWYGEGLTRLVETLETADPDLECYAFLPASSPVAFWARRQAHETGIHRADAESATGAITPFEMGVAVDGVDELLYGFIGRGGVEPPSDEELRSLRLEASDADREWLVLLGSEGVWTAKRTAAADCTVHGTASDLHLLLWNRPPRDRPHVDGDRAVLASWRDTIKITWGAARPEP